MAGRKVLTRLWQNERSVLLGNSINPMKSLRAMKLTTRNISFSFYEERSGDKIAVQSVAGKKVLDVALENNIDIEGACGGELACSTCHVKLSKELFDKLPSKKVEEDDMLDLAWGVSETSRLCCQIEVTDLLEGAVFTVPKETNNML